MNRALQIALIALVVGALIVILAVGAFACRSLNQERLDGHALVVSSATIPPQAAQAFIKLGDAATGIEVATRAATKLLSAATPVVAKLATTESKVNAAVDLASHRINDLCPDPEAVDAAIHPCGTLADANRTLATLRGTAGQVEISLTKFNKHEDDLFAQEHEAYAMMNKSVTDFDSLVSNKDLAAVIHNAATITGDTAAMTTDGKNWLHKQLYPTKSKGFVSGFEGVGDAAKHWMPPLF